MHNICCVAESEWNTHDYKMWIESWEAPPGLNEYNFDNDEYELAAAHTAPTNAAKTALLAVIESLPPLPQHHKTGF